MKFRAVLFTFLFAGLLYQTASLNFQAGQNYVGYCATEDRVLSENEMVDIAIQYIEEQKNIYIYERLGQIKRYKSVPYGSIFEFKKQNTECCKLGLNPMITSEGFLPPPGPLNRITGNYAGNVELTYKARYLDSKNLEHVIDQVSYVLMSNCGKPYFMNDY